MCCLTWSTGEPDDAVLDILRARLAPKEMNVGELLQIGDAIEVLDKGDQADITKQTKALQADEVERCEFRRHFEKKRVASRSSARSRGSSSNARKSPLTGIRKRPMPKLGELTQVGVQSLAPPGAHSWKSSQGSWQIHLPPFPRKSRSWAIEGEQEAARFVLRYAWRLYLQSQGVAESACPIVGLLDT